MNYNTLKDVSDTQDEKNVQKETVNTTTEDVSTIQANAVQKYTL